MEDHHGMAGLAATGDSSPRGSGGRSDAHPGLRQKTHRRVRSNPLRLDMSTLALSDAHAKEPYSGSSELLQLHGAKAEVPPHWVTSTGYWRTCPPMNPHATAWTRTPDFPRAQDEIQRFKLASRRLDAAISRAFPAEAGASASKCASEMPLADASGAGGADLHSGTSPAPHCRRGEPIDSGDHPDVDTRDVHSEPRGIAVVYGPEARTTLSKPTGAVSPTSRRSPPAHPTTRHSLPSSCSPLEASCRSEISPQATVLRSARAHAVCSVGRSQSSDASVPLSTNILLGMLHEVQYITLKHEEDEVLQKQQQQPTAAAAVGMEGDTHGRMRSGCGGRRQ